jgi:hypothetical protein
VNPTVEEHLAAWAAQSPTCVVTSAERQFIADMRKAWSNDVGFGWMQSIIEVEWNARLGAHGWGPRYFEGRIAELEKELAALKSRGIL